jgi:hypothetical protein
MNIMTRRQFQLGPSYFTEVHNDRGHWLREDYRILDANLEKDDRIKWHGPFDDEQWKELGR